VTYGKASFSHEQYMVEKELGRGGMGIVYLCKDRKLMKHVAVKVIAWNRSDDEVIRFHKEAKALAKLQHPNILGVQHFGHSDDDSLFLVMDLLTGRSLSELLEQGKIPPFEDALDIFVQICDGLSHAHGKGILHRDIKPSNIFVARYEAGEFKVTITDFGLARLLTEDQRLTKTGISVGSPPYMSPEQSDGKAVDERSDIYSLGCLMFETLTGERPFLAETIPALLMQHINQEPPTLAERAADRNYPPEMERIIAKCLAKRPEERYQKPKDIRQDLQKLRESIVNVSFADHGESGAYSPARSFLRTGAFIISGFQNLVRPSQERRFMRLMAVVVIILAGFGVYALSKFKPKKIELNVGLPLSKELQMGPNESYTHLNRKDAFLDDDDYFHIETQKRRPHNEPRRLREGQVWIYIDGDATKEINAIAKQTLRTRRAVDIDLKPDWIDAQKSDIDDEDLKLLIPMDVRGLNLCGTKITDKGLEYIAQYKQLVELYLDGTKITEKGLKHLRNTHIEMLRLSKTNITDEAITEISHMGKLSYIKLDDCKFIRGTTLGDLKGNHDLYHLSLRGSNLKLTNLEKLKVVDAIPSLDLSRLNLTDDDLRYIVSLKLPGLATLLLNHNKEVTDDGVIALADIKALVGLQINGCTKVTEKGIAEFHRLHEIPPTVIYASHLGQKSTYKSGFEEAAPEDN